MAIIAAEFLNVREQMILITYDDQDPRKVPNNPNNPRRIELQAWEDLGNTITPFLDAPDRLAEAKGKAAIAVRKGFNLAITSITLGAGGHSFLMDESQILYLLLVEGLGNNSGQSFLATDGVMRDLSGNDRGGLITALQTELERLYGVLSEELQNIEAATTVQEIQTLLDNSEFPNLGALYGR